MNSKFTTALALATLTLGLSGLGCSAQAGADGMNEDVDATQSEIRNGSPLDPAARPYENLMVYVSGCGGLLLGNSSGTASYVLTARHCTDDGLPAIRRPDGSIPGGGAKRVIQHPLALAGGDDTVDAALVELKRPEPTTSRVTFSNLTPQELAGQQARCYGAGNIENYGINTGVFTLAIDHRAPNSSIYYDVVLPNELGQYVSKGDSGGPCVRVTGTQDTTVFGINKAGDKYTFARQTAAVAFSEWVRTYVPR